MKYEDIKTVDDLKIWAYDEANRLNDLFSEEVDDGVGREFLFPTDYRYCVIRGMGIDTTEHLYIIPEDGEIIGERIGEFCWKDLKIIMLIPEFIHKYHLKFAQLNMAMKRKSRRRVRNESNIH